jgi:hypothetical protein
LLTVQSRMPDMMSAEEMIMERRIILPNPTKVRKRVQNSNPSPIHLTRPEGHNRFNAES